MVAAAYAVAVCAHRALEPGTPMPVSYRAAFSAARPAFFPSRPDRRRFSAAFAVAASVLFTACATSTVERSLARVDDLSRAHTGTQVRLLRAEEERVQAKTEVDALLNLPLTPEAAVRIAFAHS